MREGIVGIAIAALSLLWCSSQPQAESVLVTGQVFNGKGKDGDFSWMIVQEQYRDVLFIFNDNEEQYKAHRNDALAEDGCSVGGGNAIIRPFQCLTPPRAAGIPTGPNYEKLTVAVKEIIDEAITTIKNICAREHYKRVMYNASNGNGDLGTGIFKPGDDVKRYIVDQLKTTQ